MTLLFRILLIVSSVLAACAVITRIRRAKMQIENAVFWVLLSALLIILALFPPIIYFFTGLFGMQSPANLLFLIVIFLLLMKEFSMSVHISSLEEKLKTLAQDIAIERKDREKENGND